MNDWKNRYNISDVDTDKMEVNIIDGYVGEGYGIAN